MAVLDSARSSARQMYQGMPGATGSTSTGYSAPANNANVTSPSATAYIKEINITANQSCTASVYLVPSAGTVGNSNMIATKVFSSADTLYLTGINTMMPAGSSLYVSTTVASGATFTISGTEIQ